MSGELIALLSALLWAVSSVLMAMGARHLHVLPLNLVRCVVSTAFFWLLLPFYGGIEALGAFTLPQLAWLLVSVLGLLVVGDTLYFRAMDLAVSVLNKSLSPSLRYRIASSLWPPPRYSPRKSCRYRERLSGP